jgi:hypothetical protein
MITEKIGNVTIERFDGIDEWIVKNHNHFNQYALYNTESGCDIGAVMRHFRELDLLFAHKKTEDAIQARKNLAQVFSHIMSHNNSPALQWMVSVDSINGERLRDLSLENLKKHIEILSDEGLTQGKIEADVEIIKKKLGHN